MKETEICLLIQRKDGLFLYLDEQRHTTTPHYVKDPAKATRIKPSEGVCAKSINRSPNYYLENSTRMQDWCADCRLVPYTITTTVVTEKMGDFKCGPYNSPKPVPIFIFENDKDGIFTPTITVTGLTNFLKHH